MLSKKLIRTIMRLVRRILIHIMMLIAALLTSCNDEGINPQRDFIPIVSTGSILAAELDLPGGEGPHPALVMVHGSGRLDRSVFEGAAQNYVQLGFAVLRYDKRGVGQSTGRYLNVNAGNSKEVFPILAADVVAVTAHLADQPDIDPTRIGLIGASQAGWIMPLAAVASEYISGIVSISGATSSVGISDYYDAIAEGTLSKEAIADALEQFGGVHGYDPKIHLETLQIPALWVYGGQDKSNPTHNDIAILEEIMSVFSKNFTIHLFPDLNHHLVDVHTNQTIPETQICVNDWLLGHL